MVRSALRRVRSVLKKHGFTLGKVLGRYAPFGTAQQIIEGWNVSRVGCGKNVSLHHTGKGHVNPRNPGNTLADVVRIMRESGLPYDDRGLMACRYGNE
jgi:hypothetical protein